MKKLLTSAILSVAFLLSNSLPAFSWGSATHAYIAGKIGKSLPLMNANEMYGCMAADIFNNDFTLSPQQMTVVGYYTHGTPGNEGFMEMWKRAKGLDFQKNLAYGFVVHNDVWGIDYTAHHSGITYGQGKGYVIAKAYDLLQQLIYIDGLTPQPMPLYMIFEYIGVQNTDDQMDLAHELFETAGDIYLAQKQRLIGEKMASAALFRSNDFPKLLTKVMGNEWKDTIYTAEKEFRKTMVLYGYTLIQDQETAIMNMAEMEAQVGIGYLQAKGVPPPDIDMAKVLAEKVIRAALTLCNDYMTEVNATINFVKSALQAHGVVY
jgi:hypothetical protein